MLRSRKNFLMNCILSVAMFFMLLGSLFFYRVSIDNYIFYHFTEFSMESIWEYCLHYGNGRILGNVLCTVLSHQFFLAPWFVSITLVLMFLMINHLVFNGAYKTLLLVFIMFVAKDFGVTEEIYNNLPTFINYVFPILLFLIVICIVEIKTVSKTLRFFLSVIACMVAFASTLFSENTTVLLSFTVALIIVYKKFIEKSKIKNYLMVLISLLSGTVFILTISEILNTSEKMDEYRSVVDLSFVTVLFKAAHISEMIAVFFPAFLFLSFALIGYMVFVSKRKVNGSLVILLTILPVAIGYIYSTNNSQDSLVRLLLFSAFGLFAITVLCTIFLCFKREHLSIVLLLLLVAAANLGIMLIVSPYGLRLFYITYFCVAILVLFILKWIVAEDITISKMKISNRQIVALLLTFSLLFTVNSFLDNVEEFNRFIYPATDKQIQETINFDDNSVNFYKFIFAYRNRKYAHPMYGEYYYPNFNLAKFEP